MEFDRSYFSRHYRDYDKQNPPYKLAFYRRLAESAAGSKPGPRILDFGCAFGHFLSSLDRRWNRLGTDVSAYAIEQARIRLPNANFELWPSAAPAFDEPFDVITAFDVLEHVLDLNIARNMFARSLCPGGGLIFVVPVYDGPSGPVIRMLDRDLTHLHKKSRRFWLAWPADPFDLLDWWGIFRYLLPGGIYIHFVTKRLRRFTPAIACLFQRR